MRCMTMLIACAARIFAPLLPSATGCRWFSENTDCGAAENALRFVIFGCCLSEMVNAARLAETTDPFVRDAYRSLLADQRLHAQFGFFYLEHHVECASHVFNYLALPVTARTSLSYSHGS